MERKFLTREQIEELYRIDIDNTELGIISYTDSQNYVFEEVLLIEEEVIKKCYYVTKDGEFKGYTTNDNITLILEYIKCEGKILIDNIKNKDILITELEIITDFKFELLDGYIAKI
jgi:hypothetical protein